MPKPEIIDARGGDHVIVEGKILRNMIKNRIGTYSDQYTALLSRMNNELPSKEDAIPLMVALFVGDPSVNERALMFRAFLDRATFLDKEIRELNTIGQTFDPTQTYRITVADAARFGV